MKNILFVFLFIFSAPAFSQKNEQNDQSIKKQIDALMNTSFKRNLFNGNVLVAKNGKIIYQQSFGYSDETQKTTLNRKSIFNIGSIAKEFNAVAIMMLVERGLLKLDDPISTYRLGLPQWSEKVTTRHLINYASGIPKIESKLVVPKNDEEAWKILRSTDTLLFEPGKGYSYDNGNVFLQRRIIEKLTGQTFQAFVTQNILKPLKMTQAVFDPKPGVSNRTACFDMDNKRCREVEFISGWLWVNIHDLHTWVEALNSNRLISQKSLQTLLNNPYAAAEGGSLGRYFEKEQLQRHNGVSYKFESIYLNDFKNKTCIILVSNNLNRVWDLGHTIYQLMQGNAYEIPKKSIYQALRKQALVDVSKAIENYYVLKSTNPGEYSFENAREINSLGYEVLRAGKHKEAIDIFILATQEFPKDANIFDSLGEAYYTNMQYDLAIASYKKAIALGGTGGNAEKMIAEIEKILAQ